MSKLRDEWKATPGKLPEMMARMRAFSEANSPRSRTPKGPTPGGFFYDAITGTQPESDTEIPTVTELVSTSSAAAATASAATTGYDTETEGISEVELELIEEIGMEGVAHGAVTSAGAGAGAGDGDEGTITGGPMLATEAEADAVAVALTIGESDMELVLDDHDADDEEDVDMYLEFEGGDYPITAPAPETFI